MSRSLIRLERAPVDSSTVGCHFGTVPSLFQIFPFEIRIALDNSMFNFSVGLKGADQSPPGGCEEIIKRRTENWKKLNSDAYL